MIILIIVGVIALLSLSYLLRNKGETFSSLEKAVIAKLAEEEAKALSDFQIGKEAIIAEYERLKLRAENLVSLKAKLPTSATPQAVAPVPVAPAPVVAQPVVAVAPVIDSAPITLLTQNTGVPTVAIDPNASQTL